MRTYQPTGFIPVSAEALADQPTLTNLAARVESAHVWPSVADWQAWIKDLFGPSAEE